MRNPNEIVADALAAVRGCADLQSLEQAKAAFLGEAGRRVGPENAPRATAPD